MTTDTLRAAAAAADISERSARTWRAGKLPSETRKARSWRTRVDPFASVWESDIVPLLRGDDAGILQATTIIHALEERRPGRFCASHVRTLQRRIRDWRALQGPPREVYFEQRHVPGREAAIDFTHATELGVTIAGQAFPHLLFEFVLSYSGWRYVGLAFGETYEALAHGVQAALWTLGGAPAVMRSDNLSAATHELAKAGGRTLNRRFRAVLDHYGVESTRIQPGQSHENGIAEQAHHRLKSALAQALVIRGSKDFGTIADYVSFVRAVVEQKFNQPAATRLAEEKLLLRALPPAAIPSFTTYQPIVRKWSTIRVGDHSYSVPSRLIGHQVDVRRHPDVLEIFFKGQLVETMPRAHGIGVHRINYRHVIWSLVRKPGAFARYRYREELFPTMTFRRAYDAIRAARGDRADVEYVRILHLAASTTESNVELALSLLLGQDRAFDYIAVRDLAAPPTTCVPHVSIQAPDLRVYDSLLAGAAS